MIYTTLWKFYWMIFPQICEITTENDWIMGKKSVILTKKMLNPQRFPQTASECLDLLPCLDKYTHTCWILTKIVTLTSSTKVPLLPQLGARCQYNFYLQQDWVDLVSKPVESSAEVLAIKHLALAIAWTHNQYEEPVPESRAQHTGNSD